MRVISSYELYRFGAKLKRQKLYFRTVSLTGKLTILSANVDYGFRFIIKNIGYLSENMF